MPEKYILYKVIHLLGVAMVVGGLAGLAVRGMNGGSTRRDTRKQLMMAPGLGLALILVAGFGMAAGLGSPNAFALPWVHPKLLIFILLAAAPVLLRRKPKTGRWMFWIVPLLAAAAGYFAASRG